MDEKERTVCESWIDGQYIRYYIDEAEPRQDRPVRVWCDKTVEIPNDSGESSHMNKTQDMPWDLTDREQKKTKRCLILCSIAFAIVAIIPIVGILMK